MALERGMIVPFEPYQVKKDGDRRLVSFGTSSYGYDIRCSNEFKIFTNINSAIVDPKNFDANSFVDFRGDVCIIPPNSFALARTVEYFRIPRNVLTICLGKCVAGATRVVHTGTGDYLPIRDWCRPGRTLAYDGRRLVPATVAARAAHGPEPVMRLVTDSGYHLTATAQHPLLTPHGWRPLASLRAGDRIAVGGCLGIFGRVPLADPVGLGRAFGVQIARYPDSDVPAAVFRSPADDLWAFLRAVMGPGTLRSRSPRAVDSLRHLFDRFGVTTVATSPAAGVVQLAVTSPLWAQEEYDVRANGTTGTHGIVADTGPRFEPLVSLTGAGCQNVYDLEVSGLHNFIANGLVIHNSTYARCGIIVNVTPFEPEWEGYVTLEFSNTTPLPAKIYANEGVAQVIFFEADEPCETSYKDRGGKYQGQAGVTLPKT